MIICIRVTWSLTELRTRPHLPFTKELHTIEETFNKPLNTSTFDWKKKLTGAFKGWVEDIYLLDVRLYTTVYNLLAL